MALLLLVDAAEWDMALRVTGAISGPRETDCNSGTVEFVRGFGRSAESLDLIK